MVLEHSFMICELIETLWNVNDYVEVLIKYTFFELIETLWNVNKKSEAEKKRQVRELIETLWNVNVFTTSVHAVTVR